MKNISQYIAILLLAFFAVTLLPFNALHQHAEDEHMAAMLHHEYHPEHHCDLDEQFCQSEPNDDCGHDTHVANSHPKCFTCDFQFIKLFETTDLSAVCTQASIQATYRKCSQMMLDKAFIFVGNKGPPAVA